MFDSEFLKKLEYLSIVSKRTYVGQTQGERRSTRRGHSIEFADYKPYSVGDDFRYIDWNIFGRLDRLFLKIFFEDEDLHLYILIDASQSMDFGTPTKGEYARKIAAALAYIGLSNFDRVSLAAFNTKLIYLTPPVRGKAQIFKLFSLLEQFDLEGQTRLNYAATEYATRIKRTGIVVIISDFLDPQGYQMALKRFLYRKFGIFVIHLLSSEEVNPKLNGDLKLVDAETGKSCEITAGARTLKAYQTVMQQFCTDLETYCLARGMTYLRTTTEHPFEDLILKYLRKKHIFE